MNTLADATARRRDSGPALLRGLSWTVVALVFAFCAFSALEVVTEPTPGELYTDFADRLLSAAVRVPVFLVGAIIMLVSAVVVFNAVGAGGRARYLLALLIAVLGSLLAAVTRYLVGATPTSDGVPFIGKVFVSWLIPAIALAAGYLLYLRARGAREELDASTLRRAALDKQRQEARLRLLQAQIEPHFLFNTLSNIRRLCQSDVAAGREMLAQLARYLRAALPKFRNEEATLADEIEIVAAFLGLQKTRMGERLQFAIDVPEALRACRVPPMMLATLVENAIKHGVGPLARGGRIRVSAAMQGADLVLTVADSGRGFAASSGSGLGLANIRARLEQLHGPRAALILERGASAGVVARITLPLRPAGGANE